MWAFGLGVLAVLSPASLVALSVQACMHAGSQVVMRPQHVLGLQWQVVWWDLKCDDVLGAQHETWVVMNRCARSWPWYALVSE
jgi:hypothetical protein